MQSEYVHLLTAGKPAMGAMSAHLGARLRGFVAPLLVTLDRHLDARLVRTFAATLEALLERGDALGRGSGSSGGLHKIIWLLASRPAESSVWAGVGIEVVVP